ncbi:MAG: Rrf2 family transcriptional regulator [Chitinophagales bacterium]|jgi:Rrf2 family protein|nr:Rrf2 family transcriptional regulator [Chitinophagales bacterium]HNI45233.1 Rrf2 family transcriptional regulator [Chitinophagales bacterium]HNL06633.1 Rrf2 family transcriptional regulator [Chitinophagales bacterium]
MLSKTCEYAIKATLYLAQKAHQSERANVKTIAKAIDSPDAFTAKVLQQLVKHGIVTSVKGTNGGFFIEPQTLPNLTLLQIVVAIEGDGLVKDCVLGLKNCSNVNPCPMHDKYAPIRDNILNMLQSLLVNDLATQLEQNMIFLKSK